MTAPDPYLAGHVCRCCLASGCRCTGTELEYDSPDRVHVLCGCCFSGYCPCQGEDTHHQEINLGTAVTS